MNGLFNLDALFDESTDMDDLMDLEINMEDAEFSTKNPATNPTMDIDKDATGAHDISIPVPGGLKETPNAKPKDEQSIPIPGGLNETPTAKPKDAMSIGVPSGTTLSSAAYNNALDLLKKSYKESMEAIDMLKHVQVYDESYDDLILESLDSSEKSEIKAITKKLKSKIKESKYGSKFEPYSKWELFKAVFKQNNINKLVADVTVLKFDTILKQVFNTHGFQVLGFYSGTNITSILTDLNKMFADDLEEYKLFAIDVSSSNFGDGYIVYVDKKKNNLFSIDKKKNNLFSTNFKTASAKLSQAAKEDKKSKVSAKTESAKDECEDCDDKDKEKDEKCKDKEECVKEAYELDLDDMVV